MKFSLMFALNKYLSAGILFLAVLFVVIDLWSFEDSRDFAKKAKKASIPLYLYLYIYLLETKAELVLSSPREVTNWSANFPGGIRSSHP